MIGWLKCGRIKEYSIGLIAQIKKILASFFNVFVNCSPVLVSQHKTSALENCKFMRNFKTGGIISINICRCRPKLFSKYFERPINLS